MNNRGVKVTTAALLLAGTLGTQAAAQSAPTTPQELKVTIDSKQTARPVSPYEYGMFIEHIGSLIYRSLWSEMLDDRKFYFPIKPEEPQAAAPAQGGPFRNMQLRKWHPIGPAEAVVMDKDSLLSANRARASNSTPPHRTASASRALLWSRERNTLAASGFAPHPARR